MTPPAPSRPTGRVYQYFIDGDGDWWCDGWPVDDLDLRDALSAQLVYRGQQLMVRCEGEEHPVTFCDAPLFVQDVDCQQDDGGALASVDIVLQDGRREALQAGSLAVDGADRLFCQATPQRLQALFFRPAFYRLMDHLQEKDGSYFLDIAGSRFPIGVLD